MTQNKLYVGNLSFQTSETEIRDAFSPFGTVNSIDLIMDRETGRPRGFAFVTMSGDTEAQAAVHGLDGRPLGGRNLKVNLAKPRESHAGGGSRGEYGAGSRGRW